MRVPLRGNQSSQSGGAAQRVNQPPRGLDTTTGDYERQYLRAVIVTWSSAWDSNPESPDLETTPSHTTILQESNLPKHQSAKLFGRPHYCYGCATRAKARWIDAMDCSVQQEKVKGRAIGHSSPGLDHKKGVFTQTHLYSPFQQGIR